MHHNLSSILCRDACTASTLYTVNPPNNGAIFLSSMREIVLFQRSGQEKTLKCVESNQLDQKPIDRQYEGNGMCLHCMHIHNGGK
jgi:hypothetical protein